MDELLLHEAEDFTNQYEEAPLPSEEDYLEQLAKEREEYSAVMDMLLPEWYEDEE